MRRADVNETARLEEVGLLRAPVTLRLKMRGREVNKGLALRLTRASIPSSNISRVYQANLETAVALRNKTLALPAGAGVKVMVPFTLANCTTAWQPEGLLARRKRRDSKDGKTWRDMMIKW
jgi:hypothetical protein